MSSAIPATHEGPVTTVTLNRPTSATRSTSNCSRNFARRSPWPKPMHRSAWSCSAVPAPSFCSGLDLAEAPARSLPLSAEFIGRALRALATTRLVTVAAVHGAAIAGGAGLMSAVRLRPRHARHEIRLSEVRRGLVPALIMTFLRRQLHERDARELLLLGKLFDAPRALAIGLVNRVVADEAASTPKLGHVSSLLQGARRPPRKPKTPSGRCRRTPVRRSRRAHQYHLSARTPPRRVKASPASTEAGAEVADQIAVLGFEYGL